MISLEARLYALARPPTGFDLSLGQLLQVPGESEARQRGRRVRPRELVCGRVPAQRQRDVAAGSDVLEAGGDGHGQDGRVAARRLAVAEVLHQPEWQARYVAWPPFERRRWRRCAVWEGRGERAERFEPQHSSCHYRGFVRRWDLESIARGRFGIGKDGLGKREV